MSVPGWSGAGYIITDPETGAGAYKISGGGNGGFLIVLSLFLILMLFLGPYVLAAGSVFASSTGLFFSFLVALSGLIIGFSWLNDGQPYSQEMCLTGVNFLFGAFGFLAIGELGALLFAIFSAYPNVKLGNEVCSNAA